MVSRDAYLGRYLLRNRCHRETHFRVWMRYDDRSALIPTYPHSRIDWDRAEERDP